jgi:hypothetical protein
MHGVKGKDTDALDDCVSYKQNFFAKQFTFLSCEETSEVSVTIGHNV